MTTAAATASSDATQPETLPAAAQVPEVPSGMEAEATLLQAFASVPSISRLTVQEGPLGGQWLTVRLGGWKSHHECESKSMEPVVWN